MLFTKKTIWKDGVYYEAAKDSHASNLPSRKLREKPWKRYCVLSKSQTNGADIALFPEMWSNGYNIYGRPKESWFSEAIGTDSPFVKRFQLAAKTLQMAIGVTFLESCGTGPKNTLILFDRYGKFVFKYSKIHTCDFDYFFYVTASSEMFIGDLNLSIFLYILLNH